MSRPTARPGIRLLAGTIVLVAALLAPGLARPAAVSAITPLAPLTAGQVNHTLGREVFGFLPYWEIDSGVDAYLRYDLLTTIAFFGIDFNSDGTINTSKSGYTRYVGDTATTVIQHAHAAGVRTAITLELFGLAKNTAFFANAAAQAQAISQTVALMTLRGADGVNVDVELLDPTSFPAYGVFLANLKAATIAANPNTQLSVSTNANVSGAQMAKVALANGADRVFVMGYDYRTAGTSPVGAVSPILRADGGWSLTRTLNTYGGSYGVPLDHVLLGLPYYGRTWQTVSGALNASRVSGSASSAFFPKNMASVPAESVTLRDDPELSVRIVRQDSSGAWSQTYYDDPGTLAPKVKLTNDLNMAGLGIWALGYDRGQPGYWDVIANAFGAPQIASVTVADATASPIDPTGTLPPPPAPPVGYARSTAVTVNTAWIDGPVPATQIRLSNDGQTWSDWQPIAQTVPWSLVPGPDGSRTVYAQLLGGQTAFSKIRSGTVVLDTSPPTLAAPGLAPLARTTMVDIGITARVAWAAGDALTRIGAQAIEQSVDGGPYAPFISLSATTRTVNAAVRLGHTYRYRMTVRDLAGNTTTVEGAPGALVAADDGSTAVRFSSGWGRLSTASAYRGTVSYTTRAGTSASWTFRGSAIAVLGSVGPTRGSATVYVDGVNVGTFSAYSTTAAARQVLYSRRLSAGTHSIRIVTSGTAGHPRVDLDAFIAVR